MVSLIVVALIILVAVAVFVLPQFNRRRGGRGHTFAGCKGNLKGIGIAMLYYAEDVGGESPSLIKPHEAVPNGANGTPTEANQTDYDLGGPDRQRTYRDATESEITWEILGDQAMQNVWLMMETGHLADEKVFRCGGDRSWQRRDKEVAEYGWTDPHQYSYGMQWPYQADAAGNINPAPLGAPNTVMMADLNPGGPVSKSRPPSNHPKLGTNFLFSDAHVASSPRERSPRRMVSTLGFEGDEIYTNAAGVAGGLPQSATDTSITLSGR